MSERQSSSKKSQQLNHDHHSQTTPSTSTQQNLPEMMRNDSFSPDQIIQLQQTIGNQATQRMIAQRNTKKIIQRDPDGKIDLGGGFKGEVGVEGKIKKNSIITQINGGGNRKIPAETRVLVHDIFDKDNYFVQIPGYVVDKLFSGDKDKIKEAKTEGIENSKINKDTDGNITDSAPIKGTARKKDVSATTGQLKHRKVTEDLFPEGGAKPEHIEQRGLGNCYFLSALGSIASQHPGYLENMMTDNGATVTVRFFRKKDAPEKGFTTESVTVIKSVVKKTTTFGTRGSGLYSATHVPWPALATKAYAAWSGHSKAALPGFSGTYEGIAGGHANEVFEHVFGKESSESKIKKGLADQMSSDVPADERNLIPPGHPKRPRVEPWDASIFSPFRIYIAKANAGVFSGYLSDQEDATPEDKFKAYIKEKVADPMGFSMSDLRIEVNKWGSNAYLTAVQIITNMIDGLGESDADKWIKWLQAGGAAKISDSSKIGKAAGVVDRTQLAGFLDEADLGKTGKDAILEFSKATVIGTPQDVNYRPQDMKLANAMKDHIAGGGMVNASTPDFGKKGGGRSAGEDTETVPGLAGTHAYTVLGVEDPDDAGRIMVTMRNPWGSSGMKYEKDFSVRKEVSGGDGTFKLELSDLVRYYEKIQYSATIEQGYDPSEIKDESDDVDE